jgi:hypothetical protein
LLGVVLGLLIYLLYSKLKKRFPTTLSLWWKEKIKNFLQELSPNACDIFKQKISDCKFWKYKLLTKNHKIKDLTF